MIVQRNIMALFTVATALYILQTCRCTMSTVMSVSESGTISPLDLIAWSQRCECRVGNAADLLLGEAPVAAAGRRH